MVEVEPPLQYVTSPHSQELPGSFNSISFLNNQCKKRVSITGICNRVMNFETKFRDPVPAATNHYSLHYQKQIHHQYHHHHPIYIVIRKKRATFIF